VIADVQDAGRGRGGKRWASRGGQGIWMTLVERPASARGLDVLSLRLGLGLAEALDAMAGERIALKWPNDLYVGGGKLAGILVEARWRDQRVEWIAVGIGLNVASPDDDVPGAAGLSPGVTRLAVLDAAVPAARRACAIDTPLTTEELARFASRDLAVGRRVVEPVAGTVAGIGAGGELLVDTKAARVACRAGSLVFAEEA
jgi:BirA family biotin operon repressor/biotin-[acetyl-CoA-carboxylase] ligase